mgnify:CR=1 FL=1
MAAAVMLPLCQPQAPEPELVPLVTWRSGPDIAEGRGSHRGAREVRSRAVAKPSQNTGFSNVPPHARHQAGPSEGRNERQEGPS